MRNLTKIKENMSNLQIEEKLFSIENSIQKLSLSVKSILSHEEAAVFLNMKPSYLYKLTARKEIRFFSPLGKLNYFQKSDLEEFLLRNEIPAINKENTIENPWKK
ncbi:helix-turn-helix domain-containing protein [Flavobacterium sp. F-392]|uniref:Helix-turn-helix domain-containing protein n=2 Tax=Flavobacterium muglaense TaxID=2764716 RepID=A0A923N1M0_9FLAO|nr:helix-turn-helix domain-containing protein [Flavobacterium muglaense]